VNTDSGEVEIKSRDYWFKIVEFLQQNWALIDSDDRGSTAWFFSDTSGVFDKLTFATIGDAEDALRRNGFRRFAEDAKAQGVIALPQPPFHYHAHPNGSIYSSGRFWK
jgi:hypothetical protein